MWVLSGPSSGLSAPSSFLLLSSYPPLPRHHALKRALPFKFVPRYSVRQRASDGACPIPHLESVQQPLQELQPRMVTAVGHGSEENYAHLEKTGLDNFVKYPFFDREQKPTWLRQIHRVEDRICDAEGNQLTCPQGRLLHCRRTDRVQTANGCLTQRRVYQSPDCSRCPVKEHYTLGAGKCHCASASDWRPIANRRGTICFQRKAIDCEPGVVLRYEASSRGSNTTGASADSC